MRRLLLLIPVLLLVALSGPTIEMSPQNRVEVMKIRVNDEAITPVTARFIARSIRMAEERQVRSLVIFLDTPGGLVEATRDVVKDILHSKITVVVYVAPTGARAASAGVFITMAAHVAAMAPATSIGTAHPVQIGGLPTSPPQQPQEKQPSEQTEKKDGQETPQRATSPREEKVVNDTVAWARSLAELRGRNVEWVTRAIRESISASASEAVEIGAVDLIAEDIGALLKAVLEVEDYLYATSQLSQTTLRSVLGQAELDELLAERDRINRHLQEVIDQQTDPWGIKVSAVEVKHVDLPDIMQRAMARQAESERERRAKVIHAEGEYQAAARLRDAAETIEGHPMAMQMRFLQTVADTRDRSTMFVLPLPIDLLSSFQRQDGARDDQPVTSKPPDFPARKAASS
jgi:ATP-dependent protease ClpP protease subunit